MERRLDIENATSYQSFSSDAGYKSAAKLQESFFYESNFVSESESGGYITDFRKDFNHGTFLKIIAPVGLSRYSVYTRKKGYGSKDNAFESVSDESVSDYFNDNVWESVVYEKSKKTDAWIDDIDLIGGWEFARGGHGVSLNFGVTVPLFLKQVNNKNSNISYRDSFGIGGGGELKFNCWGGKDKSLDLVSAFDFRHFFPHTEKSMLGLKGHNWAQYFLLEDSASGKNVQAGAFLLRDTEVQPGNHIAVILGLRSELKGFVLDLGYGLQARESERIKLKETSSGGFAIARSDDQVNEPLSDTDLDLIVAEAPADVWHKAYLAVGHVFNKDKHPIILGFGSAYNYQPDFRYYRPFWSFWSKVTLIF